MTTNLNERAKMRDDILALSQAITDGEVKDITTIRVALLPVRAYRDHLLTPVELDALNDVAFSESNHLAAAKLNAVAAMMLARDAAMKEDGFVMEASIETATIQAGSLASASKVIYPHLLAEVEKLQRYEVEEMSSNPFASYRCITEDEYGDYLKLEDVIRLLGGNPDDYV